MRNYMLIQLNEGAAKKAYVLLDIEVGRGSQTLETGSDVLAVRLDNVGASAAVRFVVLFMIDDMVAPRLYWDSTWPHQSF